MEKTALKLIKPTFAYEEQVMAYKAEMHATGDSFDGCVGLEEVDSFAEWMDLDTRLKAKGYVPDQVFLCIRIADDRLVGIIDYRSPLTPFLLQCGGHIGYSIRPSERRKGYAGQMLGLLLPICKACGERRVLLTCDKSNEASRRTILKNGGVLENEVIDEAALGQSGLIQRYWITV